MLVIKDGYQCGLTRTAYNFLYNKTGQAGRLIHKYQELVIKLHKRITRNFQRRKVN